MKQYERGLLKFLNQNSYDQRDILKNIKEGMGSLREIEGNPLFKGELGITVTKNYFLNGVQILPAALPLALQTELPFFIFGLSDSHTSYANSRFYFNGFEPWIVPDNVGKRLSVEMYPWANALNPAWWDGGFGVGWAVVGNVFQFNVAPGGAAIIRNNFWIPGRRYQIIAQNAFNPSPNPATLNQFNNITNGIAGTIVYQNAGRTTTILTTEPLPGGNANLTINASTDVAGQVNFIAIHSIKEVLGDDIFTGDPAFGIYGFTKTNCLSNNVQRGDGVFTYAFQAQPNLLVNVYQDNWYVCEIIVHCNNIPYGSLLQSLASEMLVVDQIRYNVPPTPIGINQFNNPLIFLYQQMLGKMKSDSVDPNVFNTNKDFQQQICDIPVKFPVDRNLGIGTNINFDVNNLSFTFFVSKVEPLTLRSKYK